MPVKKNTRAAGLGMLKLRCESPAKLEFYGPGLNATRIAIQKSPVEKPEVTADAVVAALTGRIALGTIALGTYLNFQS